MNPSFYLRTDVVQIARDLIGCHLVTNIDGYYTAGRITETEAYRAPDDRACHAWNNRRTARTEVLFWEGAYAYIYLCYGIHHLFNVVTAPRDTAHAVLIRAIEPTEGVEIMLKRRKKTQITPALTTGPGAMAQALGLTTALNRQYLPDPDSPIRIEPRLPNFEENTIGAAARIGVDYAGECAAWPWRFFDSASKYHLPPPAILAKK
jgi:DNA-3-methyladenine glycosylase